MRGLMSASAHEYTSTACLHDECGSCRFTCKYCDSPCRHGCHRTPPAAAPVPWVDQARDIVGELLHLTRLAGFLPDELAARISTDPDLFWLRGEVQPDGTWREP